MAELIEDWRDILLALLGESPAPEEEEDPGGATPRHIPTLAEEIAMAEDEEREQDHEQTNEVGNTSFEAEIEELRRAMMQTRQTGRRR